MIPKKKNKFFNFMFSFLPGASEMYMGFIKMGSTMMAIFIFAVSMLTFFGAEDIALCFLVLIWFFSFFHARNIAGCNEQEFISIEDHYIWEEFMNEDSSKISQYVNRKWMAILLIICGIVILWKNMLDMIYNVIPYGIINFLYPVLHRIPQVAIGVIIIIIGIKLIRGKKAEMKNAEIYGNYNILSEIDEPVNESINSVVSEESENIEDQEEK